MHPVDRTKKPKTKTKKNNKNKTPCKNFTKKRSSRKNSPTQCLTKLPANKKKQQHQFIVRRWLMGFKAGWQNENFKMMFKTESELAKILQSTCL